eukprot:536710-Rhodomonas_salina.1
MERDCASPAMQANTSRAESVWYALRERLPTRHQRRAPALRYLLNGVCETCGANEFSAAGSTSCKSCPSYTSSVAGSERCECSQDAGGLCPLCVSGFESQWFTYTWDETDQATGLPNTSDPDVDAISVASPI